METLKTASGKEFLCDYFVSMDYPAQAFVRILNTSIAEVAAVFSDPAETIQLRYGECYLENYTKLAVIFVEGNAIKITLTKE